MDPRYAETKLREWRRKGVRFLSRAQVVEKCPDPEMTLLYYLRNKRILHCYIVVNEPQLALCLYS